MSDLIDTTEMYLKTIYELEEDCVTPMRARIVDRLGHSGPTVSQTIARMERDGLVVVDDTRRLVLTERGRSIATEVVRKHRLAECLLLDVIGLDWALVNDEACRWEHVMSDQVEQRLLTILSNARHDPYGNPIPGLAVPVEEEMSLTELRGRSEPRLRQREVIEVTLSRIGEPIQAVPETIQAFSKANLKPGNVIYVQFVDGGALLRLSDKEVESGLGAELSDWMEQHLFVVPGQ